MLPACFAAGFFFFFGYQPTCVVEALKRTHIPSIEAERDACFRCANMFAILQTC